MKFGEGVYLKIDIYKKSMPEADQALLDDYLKNTFIPRGESLAEGRREGILDAIDEVVVPDPDYLFNRPEAKEMIEGLGKLLKAAESIK
jgi:hypothetical protein